MRCEFGRCLSCDKEIASVCSQCGAKKANDQYTEVFVNLSNGTKMAIGVCLECPNKIFQLDRKEVMAAVRAAWHKEHDKANWSKEKRDHYWKSFGEGALEIVD